MTALGIQNNQSQASVAGVTPVVGSFSTELRLEARSNSFMRHFQTAAIILAGFIAAAEQTGSLNGLEGSSRSYTLQQRPTDRAGR